MTETYFGSNKSQITHAVSLDTNHANAFVAAGVETCWSRFDDCGDELGLEARFLDRLCDCCISEKAPTLLRERVILKLRGADPPTT